MVGKLEIILGPMYAGKSTYLLHELSRYQKATKKNVLIITSIKDTRNFLTHNNDIGIKITNIPNAKIECLTSLYNHDTKEYNESDVIGIDEAQFFTDLERFCKTAVERDNKHVIVSGLAQDFERKKFGYITNLIPFADKIVHLTALCHCGKDAVFSKRITESKEQVLVGASESYIPVCREHYLN